MITLSTGILALCRERSRPRPSRPHDVRLGCVLVLVVIVALLFPGGASALTNGFHVVNLSPYTMKLMSFSACPDCQSHIDSRPPDGALLGPGLLHDFEITYILFLNQYYTARYAVLDSAGNFIGEFDAGLSLMGLREMGMSCAVTPGAPVSCVSDGRAQAIVAEPPGTLHFISPAQKEEQAKRLNQLCANNQALATCTFKPKSETNVESPEHPVGGYVNNNSDVNQEKDVGIKDTVGESNSVEVAVEVGGKLFKVVDVSIAATYGHEWTHEHEFDETIRMTIPPHQKCLVLGSAPMLRDTGDFSITMGNSTWNITDVYFDSPNPLQAGTYGYDIDCTKLTPSEKAALPQGNVTITPRVGAPAVYTIPREASRTPIARPKLRLSILGPRALFPGQRARYRLLLTRSQPRHQVVQSPGNVRVRVRLGRRTVGHWLVPTLPVGRTRGLGFRLRVPSRTTSEACLTADAVARNAITGRARACVVRKEAPTPLSGLG